jgi:hypothetical protein
MARPLNGSDNRVLAGGSQFVLELLSRSFTDFDSDHEELFIRDMR